MIEGIRLANVLIDCGDADAMCDFYQSMLGWERFTLFGYPTLRDACGHMLMFAREDDYVPPVWPEAPGAQQKQMHLDFVVPDVASAVVQALALGAIKAADQFGGEDFVTLYDPAGHPFCLCRAG